MRNRLRNRLRHPLQVLCFQRWGGLACPIGLYGAPFVTRYRAAEMVYQIQDPLLGSGTLELMVLALSQTEGVVVRAALSGVIAPMALVWAYGGASGERSSRVGIMGVTFYPATFQADTS